MKRIILTTIILSTYLGCKRPNNNTVRTASDKVVQDTQKDSVEKNESSVNQESQKKRKNISCDSLMILLIKSSSIDRLALKERIGIDSIKNKVVYLTFSHINKENGTEHNSFYVDVDLNKGEVRQVTEQIEFLKFNKELLNCLIKRQCYFKDANYVTEDQ